MAKAPEALVHRVFDIRPSKGDQRRIQIIESAIHCLATLGIADASLEVIGKRLGIKSAHIIYYFKDRETLLDAAFKYVAGVGTEMFIARVTAGNSPVERLRGYVDAIFDWIEFYPEHIRVMVLLHYQSTYDPKLREIQTQLRLAGLKRIQAIVEPLTQARGKHGNPEELAHLIYCALTGYYVEFLGVRSGKSLADWRAEAMRSILAIVGVGGVRGRARP